MYTVSTAIFDIYPVLLEGVDNVFQQRLDDREQRRKVAEALMQWLTKARKKEVPDLAEKLRNMQQRVNKLVEGMTIEIEKDKPVVRTAGSDEDTWKMFRLGTSWFEPNPDLIETVLSGLFNE